MIKGESARFEVKGKIWLRPDGSEYYFNLVRDKYTGEVKQKSPKWFSLRLKWRHLNNFWRGEPLQHLWMEVCFDKNQWGIP